MTASTHRHHPRNRKNVSGTGPDRDQLPLGLRLGSVPASIMEVCNREIDRSIAEGISHVSTEYYPISSDSPLIDLFSKKYVQSMVQIPETDGQDERDYTRKFSPVVDAMAAEYPDLRFFRGRLAKLPPGEVLDWHIDTNTSVYCRLQFFIRGGCTWMIRNRKNPVETWDVSAGQVWFFNTGFMHRVENHTSEDRWVLIINCDYDSIEKTFGRIEI